MSISLFFIKESVANNTLTLHNRHNEDEDVQVICDYLNENPSITTLNVSCSRLTPAGLKMILDVKSLRSLDISWNPKLNEHLIESLKLAPHLTELKADNNQINDELAIELAKIENLSSLSLKSNSIGSKGAIALSVKSQLDLSQNKIGPNGIKVLQDKNFEEHVYANQAPANDLNDKFEVNDDATVEFHSTISWCVLAGMIALSIAAVVLALIFVSCSPLTLAAGAVFIYGATQMHSGLASLGIFGRNNANSDSPVLAKYEAPVIEMN